MRFKIIGGFVPSNDLNYRSGSSVFYYAIFGHFLRLEVNKLKLWMSCYYRCCRCLSGEKSKRTCAWADLHICSTMSWALSGNWWIWTRWQVQRAAALKAKTAISVWEWLQRRWKCRKENAQRKTKNNIPPLTLLFHTSMWVSLFLLFISHV